jgi:hypothetical protein
VLTLASLLLTTVLVAPPRAQADAAAAPTALRGPRWDAVVPAPSSVAPTAVRPSDLREPFAARVVARMVKPAAIPPIAVPRASVTVPPAPTATPTFVPMPLRDPFAGNARRGASAPVAPTPGLRTPFGART